jgi:DNA-binding NarL/FixJ family response regulator
MKPSKPAAAVRRVLIVDDHPAVREGLALRIERQPDLEVCGEAADVGDALRLVASSNPDVAIIDISLKTGSGIDLIKRIKSHSESVRMLVWSMHNETLYAERALRAGAMGYISKEQATDQIVTAIRQVLQGKVFLSQPMSERLLTRALHQRTDELVRSPIEHLSDREMEVFRLIGEGLGTGEIAVKMRVGRKTVETYRARLKEKLDLSGSPELMRRAVEWVLEQ